MSGVGVLKGLNALRPSKPGRWRRARRTDPVPDRAPASPAAGAPPGPPPGADWRVVAPVGLLRMPVPLPCGLGAFRQDLAAWCPAPLVTADGRLLPRGVPLAVELADHGTPLMGLAELPPLAGALSRSEEPGEGVEVTPPVPPLPGTGDFAPVPPVGARHVDRRSGEHGVGTRHEGGAVEEPRLSSGQGSGADRRARSGPDDRPGASEGAVPPEPRTPGPASDRGRDQGRRALGEAHEAGAPGSAEHGRHKAARRPGRPLSPERDADDRIRSEPFVTGPPAGPVPTEDSRGPGEVSVPGALRYPARDGDVLGHREAHNVGSPGEPGRHGDRGEPGGSSGSPLLRSFGHRHGSPARDGDLGVTPRQGLLHRHGPDGGGADGHGPARGPEEHRAQPHRAEAPSTSWAPGHRRSQPDRGSADVPDPPEVLGHHPDRPGQGGLPGLRFPSSGRHRRHRSDKGAADGPSASKGPGRPQDQPSQGEALGFGLPWNLGHRQDRPHCIAADNPGSPRDPEHPRARAGHSEVPGPGSPSISGHAEPRGGHSRTRATSPQRSGRPPGRQDHDAFPLTAPPGIPEQLGGRRTPGEPPGPNPPWGPGRGHGSEKGRDRDTRPTTGSLPPAGPRHRLGVGQPLPQVPGTAMPFVTPPPAGNERPPGTAAGEPSTAAPFASAPAPTSAPRTAHSPAPPDAAAVARDVAQEVARRHAGLLADAVVPALGFSRRTRRAATRWQSQSPPAPPPTQDNPWGTYPPR